MTHSYIQYDFLPVRGGSVRRLCHQVCASFRRLHLCLSHVLGCHYIGGGGIFLKAKQLALKCVGTQKRLLSGFGIFGVGSYRRNNFLPRHIAKKQAGMHI